MKAIYTREVLKENEENDSCMGYEDIESIYSQAYEELSRLEYYAEIGEKFLYAIKNEEHFFETPKSLWYPDEEDLERLIQIKIKESKEDNLK